MYINCVIKSNKLHLQGQKYTFRSLFIQRLKKRCDIIIIIIVVVVVVVLVVVVVVVVVVVIIIINILITNIIVVYLNILFAMLTMSLNIMYFLAHLLPKLFIRFRLVA